MCDHALGELITGAEAVGDRDKVPETVGMFYEAMDACRHALDETLRQLGPAVVPPSAGPTIRSRFWRCWLSVSPPWSSA